MFARESTAVSFSSAGVAFARVAGPPSAPRLERVSFRPLPTGVLRFSLREPNILDAETVAASLVEARNALLCRVGRVFVTVPDTVGRVLLLDVEERFSSRSEGLDILRWKLEKKLPFSGADIHLDFQQLATRDNGSRVVLVALALRDVVRQYEEVLASAGLAPSHIDFNCFNLCRLFEQRFACHEEYALLFSFSASLGMLFFSQGSLVCIRIKELGGDRPMKDRLHKEIRCSFLSYRDRYPERAIRQVFCIASPPTAPELCRVARDVLECEPVLLEAKGAVAPREGVPLDQGSLFPFSAAIGAAFRGL